MRNLKFSANLSFMFKEFENVLDRYSAAKEGGFKAVELAFPYEIPLQEIKERKELCGLEQVLINAFPGNKEDFGLAALPNREQEFQESVKLSLTYAKALGCKRIHFMSGKLPGRENSPEVLQTLKNNLAQIVPILETEGTVGLIEPINNHTVPGYALSNFDAALAIVKSLNSANVRMQVDLFHLQKTHGNVTQRLEELLPYTGHIQIAQVPHRNEPHLPGELDYEYIFDLLEELRYSEWIGLEYNSDRKYALGGGGTLQGLSDWMGKFRCRL